MAEDAVAFESAEAPPAVESISAPQADSASVAGKVESPESTESSYGM